MMKITGLSYLFKWENLHNWWLTKYFFAPLYITMLILSCRDRIIVDCALTAVNNVGTQMNGLSLFTQCIFHIHLLA